MKKKTSYDDLKYLCSINGDINYVKDYIRKYKHVNNSLTHDNYGNRLIHKVQKVSIKI